VLPLWNPAQDSVGEPLLLSSETHGPPEPWGPKSPLTKSAAYVYIDPPLACPPVCIFN
jgi:hypothetical protein